MKTHRNSASFSLDIKGPEMYNNNNNSLVLGMTAHINTAELNIHSHRRGVS